MEEYLAVVHIEREAVVQGWLIVNVHELARVVGSPGEKYNGVFFANEYLSKNNLVKACRVDYVTPSMR